MRFSKAFVAMLTLVALSCAEDKELSPLPVSSAERIEHGMPFGVPIPTAQLVTWIYEGDNCPSGWTMLYDELAGSDGNERIIPLQPTYVDRFATLDDLRLELVNAMAEIGDQMPIVSIGLSWVCWVGDESGEWQSGMVAMIGELLELDITVYINLNHNDSFPAELWDFDDIGNSGWANERFIESWRDYVADVIRVFTGDNEFGVVLPPDTRVSLGQETMVALFNGYLHHEAKYPPGGMRAGISFTHAFANWQKASVATASMIADDTDWMPTIGHNVRPIMDASLSAGAEKLDLAHNWVLLDALTTGCIDEDLEDGCEEMLDPPSRFEIGVTFYGTMVSSDETVTVGASLTNGTEMTIPSIDVSPNADTFRLALDMLVERYPGVSLAIAELGFSEAVQQEALDQFGDYVAHLRSPNEPDDGRIAVAYVLLHALFLAAEFSQGDWFFNIIKTCLAVGECVVTDWGALFLSRISQI